MSLTASLCSTQNLAPAKYLQSSLEMLVIALDSLWLSFSGQVLDFRED